MRRARFIVLPLLAAMAFAGNLHAQQSVVDAINSYGKFDNWSKREVKESGLIGVRPNVYMNSTEIKRLSSQVRLRSLHRKDISGEQTMSLPSWLVS